MDEEKLENKADSALLVEQRPETSHYPYVAIMTIFAIACAFACFMWNMQVNPEPATLQMQQAYAFQKQQAESNKQTNDRILSMQEMMVKACVAQQGVPEVTGQNIVCRSKK